MRMILVLVLTLGLASGGCAWFGGSSAEEVKPAQPQEQATAPEPAPEAPAKPSKPKTKAEKAAEKKAAAEKAAAEKAAAKKAEKAPSKKGAKTEAQIAAELNMVGRKLAAQAARTLMPSKASKEVRQDGKGYVASYVDVDAEKVTTELRPGASGQFVGFIRYQEKVMECRGATKQAALSAPCEQIKARNLNELIRYDGQSWQY